MNKKFLILTLITLLLLVACGGNTSEEAAISNNAPSNEFALSPVNAEPGNAPDNNGNDAMNDNDSNDAGVVEGEPAGSDSAYPSSDLPVNENGDVADPGDPITEGYPGEGEPVEPVVVDLSEITPVPPENTDPQVLPAPGSPDPSKAMTAYATQDLAQRLNVDVSQIIVVEIIETQWNDSSLGCPAPNMGYLDVITPGFQITLEVDGQQFDYHTDTYQNVVLCGADGQPVE